MSFEPLSAGRIRGAAPLAQSLLDLRKSQAGLALLVARLFEDLERRRRQLDREARELRTARAEVERVAQRQLPTRQPAGEAPAPEGDPTAGHAAADAEQQALAARQAAAAQERLLQLEEERGKLARSLEAARSQIAQLTAAGPVDLAEMRTQMAALRDELAAAHRSACAPAGGASLERMHELELERQSLRSELDAARKYATDLAEQLAQCRRQFDTERAEWHAELRQLLRLLERQSHTLEERLPGCGGEAPTGPPPAADRLAADGAAQRDEQHDPVLGAVLAQLDEFPSNLPAPVPMVLPLLGVPTG